VRDPTRRKIAAAASTAKKARSSINGTPTAIIRKASAAQPAAQSWRSGILRQTAPQVLGLAVSRTAMTPVRISGKN